MDDLLIEYFKKNVVLTKEELENLKTKILELQDETEPRVVIYVESNTEIEPQVVNVCHLCGRKISHLEEYDKFLCSTYCIILDDQIERFKNTVAKVTKEELVKTKEFSKDIECQEKYLQKIKYDEKVKKIRRKS